MKGGRKIQILTLGDSKVGKTSLLKRYDDNAFNSNHLTTIGIDFITKQANIKDELVTLKIWDTAGQERFRTITHSFYKQAEGVLVVFDVTDHKSYESLSGWMSSIQEHADVNIIKYLVGNKIDLTEGRKVSKEEGEEMAKRYEMKYFETSAKDNINVAETIEGLANEIFEKAAVKEDHMKIVSGQEKKPGENGGCCTII